MKSIVLLVIACITPLAADETPAVAAASAWLRHLDKGDYEASWESASDYFKQRVTEDEWRKAAKGIREPLGKLESRKLISATPTKTLPGAPEGDYVIITYKSRFANKAEAVETITPMLQKNGTWRVSGYFIK